MRKNQRTDNAPNVRPGQIWLIEQTAATGPVALDRGALGSADVVLYDRALAALVAPLLPAGRYAEPLSADGAVISPRALKLAADGWSVVQLIEPCRGWRKRLSNAAAELRPLSVSGSIAVQLIAKTAAEGCRTREASLPELPELVDELAEDDLVTLIIGPLVGGIAAATCACTANGLAG
jgi:hypothetical protein